MREVLVYYDALDQQCVLERSSDLAVHLDQLKVDVLALEADPDCPMAYWGIAYAAGPKPGAMAYNALHSTIGPAALAGMGFLVKDMTLLAIAAVWAAHIGFDRMLGYGLKYSSAFGDTHLGRIGRAGA